MKFTCWLRADFIKVDAFILTAKTQWRCVHSINIILIAIRSIL